MTFRTGTFHWRNVLAVAFTCVTVLASGLFSTERAGASQVLTFGYTGGEQSFVVPAGVTSLAVVATGAPGERGESFQPPGPGGDFGFGAVVRTIIEVSPGQVLYANVGGSGPAGGFNGGGPGNGSNVFQGGDGGDGGGATDLRSCSASALFCPNGGSSLNSRLVVAGGGGGGGGGNGGQPEPAGDGGSGSDLAGIGGSGSGGQSPPFSGLGGQGATPGAPGAGGAGNNGQQSGFSGNGAVGGSGGDNSGNSGGGGGGGGGMFGGGGGGSGFGGGGGGAGSSYGPSGTQFSTDVTGVPSLFIYFSPPEVATGTVSGVTETAATLGGAVNPRGRETTWQFEYGRSSGETSLVPVLPESSGSGTGMVSVSTNLTDLAPGTRYVYRLVAENASGSSAGAFREFVTMTSPNPPAQPARLSTSVAIVTRRPRAARRLSLRVRVANQGPGAAARVVARVTLPRSVQFLSGARDCRGNGTSVVCVLPAELASQANRQFNLRARATRPGAVRIKVQATTTSDPRIARGSVNGRIRERR